MISVVEAFRKIAETALPLPADTATLRELVGRRLLAPVLADIDSPPHDKSMMDGFAVRANDVRADADFEIVETIVAGQVPTKSLGPVQAARIMTGAPLPMGSDAVVMVELATVSDDGSRVRFQIDSLKAEHHILRAAANFAKGDVMFSAGHQVRPADVGLLAEVGAASLKVAKRPSVAVLPTGDELVACDQRPGAGQIRNSNGPMLLAKLDASSAEAVDLGIGRDDEVELRAKMERGLEHDMLILSGGVSAGQRDLVPDLLQSLGVQEVFHKVLVKPGKPIWFGFRDHNGNRTLVFGLPGNPVSSLVGFHLFVRSALQLMSGGAADRVESVMACLACDHQTRGNRPTYWPGQLVIDDEATRLVLPLPWNGSSDLLALGKADGLIFFTADEHDHAAGKQVSFLPF